MHEGEQQHSSLPFASHRHDEANARDEEGRSKRRGENSEETRPEEEANDTGTRGTLQSSPHQGQRTRA